MYGPMQALIVTHTSRSGGVHIPKLKKIKLGFKNHQCHFRRGNSQRVLFAKLREEKKKIIHLYYAMISYLSLLTKYTCDVNKRLYYPKGNSHVFFLQNNFTWKNNKIDCLRDICMEFILLKGFDS